VVWLYLFFFVTGATGLVYEVTFARQLQLIFGSTLSAVSVVVAIFFGGMALGAALLGRYADRMLPIRFYGLLEMCAGISAFMAVLLIPQIRHFYADAYPYIQHSVILKYLTRSLMAVVVLLPPTIFMGATLPALSKGLTQVFGKRFTKIGLLYGLNTVGAALGAFLCGFLLLEFLGFTNSVLLAAFLNFSVGLVATLLAPKFWKWITGTPEFKLEPAAHHKARPSTDGDKKTATVSRFSSKSRTARLILIVSGLSGLAALGYEIVWFRTLSFSIVTDAYALALLLFVYLIGIGLGSLIAGWRFRRKEGSYLELGVMEVVLAVVVLGTFWLSTEIINKIADPQLSDPSYWSKVLYSTTLKALIMIFPGTLLLGYIFPLIVSLFTSRLRSMGRQVGSVLSVNTVGSILGSISAGFLFIPLLGIQKSLMFFAGLSALIGFAVLTLGNMPGKSRFRILPVAVPVLIIIFFVFPVKSNFGFLQTLGPESADLLFYKESADQTVMVTRDRGGRRIQRLILNQQQATSTSLHGQRKNQILGHLPVWSCPDARKALVICFGSGGTFGSLGLYDLERVDCVDICPAVIEAAPFFREWNGDVLSKPNVRVIIDDGRSYLLTTDQTYDIITLEPMHPGLKGVSSLYSREFYYEAREKLNPGGVLAQWIPLYSMDGDDARSLMATALDVFPQSSLWLIGTEGIMLCARDSLRIDWEFINESFKNIRIQAALKKVRLSDPWAILSGYLLGPAALAEYLNGVEIMTDDRPFTEFTIPRHQHLSPWDEILTLSEKRESPIPQLSGMSSRTTDSLYAIWQSRRDIWNDRDRGFAKYSRGEINEARKLLEAAYKENPTDAYTLYFLKEIYWKYARELGRRGAIDDAVRVYEIAMRMETDDPDAHFYLAAAYARAGDFKEAIEEAKTSLKLDPDHRSARALLSDLESRRISQK
jgi:spermidine synthase